MADYQILFQKADTIASGSNLNPGATQFLLTSGNFGTHTDYYVVDYDIPSLAEVVEVAVNGTTASVISRGRDGTSQQPHSQGAKIGSMWTLSHQLRIQNAVNALVPVSQQAYATADLGQTIADNIPKPMPGCTLTVLTPVAGTFLISVNADFESYPATGQTIILGGDLIVDGTAARGVLIFQSSSPAAAQMTTRATVEKSWVIPALASTTPHTFLFQARRIVGAGSSLLHNDHTSLIVTYNPTVVL